MTTAATSPALALPRARLGDGRRPRFAFEHCLLSLLGIAIWLVLIPSELLRL